MLVNRRLLLGAAGVGGLGAAIFAASPKLTVAAAPTNQRFVFIMLRGAADGLGIVAPTADPGLRALRAALLTEDAATKLDGMFTLHPALVETAKLYGAGEAAFVHAIASPYRDRSHFDGQNVLESGGAKAYQLRDGWMNRMLSLLPAGDSDALAIASAVPLALRGERQVESYAPTALPDASDDLLARAGRLYGQDRQLGPMWSQAIETRARVASAAPSGSGPKSSSTAELAATLLSGPSAARIAFIESSGWDTHSGQRARLAGRLKELDGMIASLRRGLGADWQRTVVVVATEFGRTARVNGTGGTDHGTASTAMLLGGAIKGGRVIADWPGLSPSALYEGRDLKPTMNLDALIANTVAQHYALEVDLVGRTLFPSSDGFDRIDGLVRT